MADFVAMLLSRRDQRMERRLMYYNYTVHYRYLCAIKRERELLRENERAMQQVDRARIGKCSKYLGGNLMFDHDHIETVST